MNQKIIEEIVNILLNNPTVRRILELLQQQSLEPLAEQTQFSLPEEKIRKLDYDTLLKIAYVFMHHGGRSGRIQIKEEVADFVREAYIAVLGHKYYGNISHFAEDYGINRNSVHYHLKILGISEEIKAHRTGDYRRSNKNQ